MKTLRRARSSSVFLNASSQPHWRRGAMLNALMAALAAASILLTAAFTTSSVMRRQPAGPPPMSISELEVALRRNHITPESLAALGISAQQTSTLITQAQEYLSPAIQALRSEQAECATARSNLDRLEREVRAGMRIPQSVQELATARTALASNEAALNGRLHAVRSAGTAELLTQPQIATLEAIILNSAWSVPIEYRCRSGASESDWVDLRDALANQRIAQREESPASPEAQQILTQWQSDPAVSTARANLQVHLEEVQAAWRTALR